MKLAVRPGVDESSDAVWAWVFRSPHELRKALEEYAEFANGHGFGDGGGDEDERDRRWRIYAQNLAIDHAMTYIGAASPYAWKLIDAYFRRGLWAERRGWVKACEMAGLPTPECVAWVRCRLQGDDRIGLRVCPHTSCPDDYGYFEEHVALSVDALFAAVERRWQRYT